MARDADAELWPEARGEILHEAVHALTSARDAQGVYSITPEEALEQAWSAKRPKGLIRSVRLERYERSRMLESSPRLPGEGI